MARPTLVRPPRDLLADLMARHAHDDTPIVYTDPRWLVRELFWRRLGALLALSRARPGGRVLDLGGGNGVLLPTLARRFDEVACVDLDVAMARALVEHESLGTRVSTFEGPLERHAFPDGRLDTVVAADVLEHFPDARGVAAEIARVLRPGGELLVSLPSENRFYRLGRAAAGYTKPEDHYHEGEAVLAALEPHLALERRRHFPLDVGPLGVFLLARLVRRA